MASADTSFVDQVTTVIAAWLQPVNDWLWKRFNPTYATSTGAANTYTLTLPSTSLLNVLQAGQEFTFKAHQTNTGAATFSVVGQTTLGPTTININGGALSGSEIQSGDIVKLTYDGTVWQMPRVPSAVSVWCGTAGGSADAITLTPGTPITAYVAGQTFRFIAGNTTSGAAATVAVSGLATKSLLKAGAAGLVGMAMGDVTTGIAYQVLYDGTQFELQYITPYAQGTAVASAATINLNATVGDYVHITGVITCTAITLAQGEQRTTVTDGVMQFTNGASLILPGGQNITSAANATQIWRGEASGVVRCILYASSNSGWFVKRTVIASGSGTFTTQASTTQAFVEAWGAGAGGGGAAAATGNSSPAGGGGAGQKTEKLFSVVGSTGYSYAVGAGGAGGLAAGPTAGSPGGNTTFTVGATTLTAHGATGGGATSGSSAGAGGAGGTGATNGDAVINGAPGSQGFFQGSTSVAQSGEGGGSSFGTGGFWAGGAGSAAGISAAVPAAGGSGGCIVNATGSQPGGTGGAGYLIVTEYT